MARVMAPPRSSLWLCASPLALVAGLAFGYAALVPVRLLGSEVSSGNDRLILEPGDYWRLTRTVESSVRFVDAYGVNRIVKAPQFLVLRIDPATKEITNRPVDTVPLVANPTTIRWDFRYVVPDGLKFFGIAIEDGSYEDGHGKEQSLDDGSIGCYAEP